MFKLIILIINFCCSSTFFATSSQLKPVYVCTRKKINLKDKNIDYYEKNIEDDFDYLENYKKIKYVKKYNNKPIYVAKRKILYKQKYKKNKMNFNIEN